MIGFLIGLAVGGLLGVLTMALIVGGSRGERHG